MTRRVFLGVDCGTQSTKALLLDAETGEVVAVGRAPHELIAREDGTREQHPAWWIEALTQAVRSAIAEAADRADGPIEVAGMGVSGQQHGLVALDAADRPARPAKLWNDTTTALDCRALTDAVGGRAAALALTGNLFLPGYTAPKIAWLRRCEPDVYRAARRFCLPHDYLDLWLTGAFYTEPGDASGTAYLDARERRYSPRVLGVLDDARDWDAALPPVIPSVSVGGRLRRDAAVALGLTDGIPVSGGGGDNMCAAIGTGASREGPVVVSLGTSGTAFAYRGAPAVDPQGEAAVFCDSTGGWLPLVCTLNCTLATDWVSALVGLDRSGFEAALGETEAGADGLTFLPHLDGERTPDLPRAGGVFTGMRATHGPAHLARAVAEGVTFGLDYALRALYRTGVEARTITLVGGGAASDAWAQLCADAFRVPVLRPPVTEAAALGAALQAAWAVDGRAVATEVRPDGLVADSLADGEAADTVERGASVRRFEPHPRAALVEAMKRADDLRAIASRHAL